VVFRSWRKNTLEKVSFLLVRFLWTSKENEHNSIIINCFIFYSKELLDNSEQKSYVEFTLNASALL